jgi:mRNA interferase RelE/StbE
MKYAVEFTSRTKKNLSSVPKRDAAKIVEKIALLQGEPRPRWMEKLKARPGFRISVGNYRIVYSIDDNKKLISILDINDRKDVYKN